MTDAAYTQPTSSRRHQVMLAIAIGLFVLSIPVVSIEALSVVWFPVFAALFVSSLLAITFGGISIKEQRSGLAAILGGSMTLIGSLALYGWFLLNS